MTTTNSCKTGPNFMDSAAPDSVLMAYNFVLTELAKEFSAKVSGDFSLTVTNSIKLASG